MKTFSLLALLLPISALAAPESHYQAEHCKGQIEVVLSDRTRVDCLTADVAWEYDFAKNWYSSVGQALHYARMTGKVPGIVLIIEGPEDCRYLERLHAVQEEFLPELKVVALGACPLTVEVLIPPGR